jgi:RHS repeat-associated protein
MPTHSRKTILLATDQQRSVLSALDEHQPRSIAYTPYGHRTRENGLLSLLGFNGELPDPLTGCYHLGKGYRQFNPVLMRFNSPDSWSPFGAGGFNAYGYCGGNPVNRRDPNGHAWFKEFITSMQKNISRSSTETHPTQRLSQTTLKSLTNTVEALGGVKKISELAKKSNMRPADYFIENIPELNPLKEIPFPPISHSSTPIIEQRIGALINREITQIDIQAGVTFSRSDKIYVAELIEQTRKTTDNGRDFQRAISHTLPSYTHLQDPSISNQFPSPPSYIDATRQK